MTPVEQGRLRGFTLSLQLRGREAEADTKLANGSFERLTVLVEDLPMMGDPDKPLQGQKPIFTRLSAVAGVIKDPRAPTRFTEKRTGRFHKVLGFDESSADAVTWRWNCEAQRQ